MNPDIQIPGPPPRVRGRCSTQVEPLDPLLPVIGTGSLTQVRKSRTSRWRAGVLIGVHLLIAAHAAHYLLSGRTLSPVEPSESMYTLELGFLNCGFIFFAAALVATLVFGRYFCGWGCHIVALQDLCGWMMKKLGVRPRAFRSRFLAFVPVLLAAYMFFWPSIKRVLFDARPFPGWSNHLLTDGFWRTFPGPVFAVLTLAVCGFAAVYFLGAKGFCTYGCPYGALFGGLDALSPGRIVVSDACEQCGHCTATCTSNVRVHEEVRMFGRVVDPGCMKCMDCVSVCPKGALSFGFARPALFKGAPPAPRARTYDLTLVEESFVGLVGIAGTLAFRGLYDGPPLLMSAGLGGITAYGALMLYRLARSPNVRLQNLSLKVGGSVQRSGFVFASLMGAWVLFAAHSGFVQWHRAWGMHYLDRTEASRADVLSGAFAQKSYSPAHARALARASSHLATADRWGLAGVIEIKQGLAWTDLLSGRPQEAEARVREAIALSPNDPALRRNLYEIATARGDTAAAINALGDTIRLEPAPTAAERFQLAGLLAEAGRMEEAAAAYRECLKAEPDSAEAHYDLGGVLRRLGRNREAIAELRAAEALAPADADTQVELGLALMAAGVNGEAIAAFRRAIELAPDAPESRMHLPDLIRQLESQPSASSP